MASDSLSTGSEDVRLTFNGDTGSDYDYFLSFGGSGGGSAAGNNQTYILPCSVSDQTSIANGAAGCEITIMSYANTTFVKNLVSLNNRLNTSTSGFVLIWSGDWRSTSAVTSITLTASAGSFLSGSTFTLYGVQ